MNEDHVVFKAPCGAWYDYEDTLRSHISCCTACKFAQEALRYKEALEDIRCATQEFHDADPECEYKHSEDYCDCDKRRANKALFPFEKP